MVAPTKVMRQFCKEPTRSCDSLDVDDRARGWRLRRECPVCCGRMFSPFIDFGSIPRSGFLLEGSNDAAKSMTHSLEFCNTCGLIRTLHFFEERWNYSEDRRVTGAQCPDYVDEVLEQLRAMGVAYDDLLVDVGGNDGQFLTVMRKKGWLRRLNVEPGRAAAERCAGRGHMVENVYFDYQKALRIRAKYGPAKAVSCRHVLEHVESPYDFLVALRALIAQEGVLFIETPDARGITQDVLGHELWDQHLYHFTPTNLERLLVRSGYCVERRAIRPHRGGRNVLVWARPTNDSPYIELSEAEFIEDVRACQEFSLHWNRLTRQIRAELAMWPRPIACFGASHPQSNYLLFTGVGMHVAFAVDDDPEKVGRWLPVPQPVPVVSTEELLSGILPGTIVRTAFGCDSWMEPVCEVLASKGVHVVEPYPKRAMEALVGE